MITDAHYYYKKKLLFTFLVTAACFIFTYFYYGFYYVEYEALFDSFYSGKLTGGLPFRSIYFLGNIGTSYIYSFLYEILPKVEWISWILYSYLFVSCLICLYLIIDILPDSAPWWAKAVAQVTVYFLVFADQNIHFIFTRVSYMVAGFSLIGLLYFFRLPGSIKKHPLLFISLNLWFIIGTLTRSESAGLIFLQIALFGIFYLQNIRRVMALFLFPFLFLFSILSAITYDIKTTKEFYMQIEPDIEEQFVDRGNAVPISDMKTYRDSVMWRTAKDIMWADPRVISPAYMRSLILPEKFIFTDVRQWQRVIRDVSPVLLRFWHLCLICILLGVVILIRGKNTSMNRFILWLVFAGSFWLIIAVQTYSAKVNDRCFSPPISLFIFCHVILLLPYIKSGIPRMAYPVLIGIAVLFCFHLKYLRTESGQLKYDLEEYQHDMKGITNLATGKVLVVNSSSCNFLFSANKPFHPFDFSAFKKIYITDGFNMPFLPYYRRYLEKECACNMLDYPSFWDYLRTRHVEVVIVSDPQRMNIIKEYLRVIHNYNLPVTLYNEAQLHQLEKSDGRGMFDKINVYTLGR